MCNTFFTLPFLRNDPTHHDKEGGNTSNMHKHSTKRHIIQLYQCNNVMSLMCCVEMVVTDNLYQQWNWNRNILINSHLFGWSPNVTF